jgi:hypothetical protein
MLDFFRISSISDDAIIKRKGFIFSERQIVKTSGKDDLEVSLHGTWNWLKRWWVGIRFAIGILNVKLNN